MTRDIGPRQLMRNGNGMLPGSVMGSCGGSPGRSHGPEAKLLVT